MILNGILLIGTLFLFVGLALYAWSIIERYANTYQNVDWGIIFQLLIFWALPGLLTILGIIWLVGFLFKVSRKLDE